MLSKSSDTSTPSKNATSADLTLGRPNERENELSGSGYRNAVKDHSYHLLYEGSCRVLPRFSGQPHHLSSVVDLLKIFSSKYKEQYQIAFKTCANLTNRNVLKEFLTSNKLCALILKSGPHHSAIIQLNEKIVVFEKTREEFVSYLSFLPEDNIYCLDPEIFKKPPEEPLQDKEVIHYQSDDVSCGIFSAKIIKEMLINEGETAKHTLFDEKTKTFYPPPIVFKQSQSNVFLKYYVKRYFAMKAKLSPNTYTSSELQAEQKKSFKDLGAYRIERLGKARTFYYNLKHFPHINAAFSDVKPY